jgi:acyl dehydratase
VHWDPAFARRAGNPTTYDYGRMRETWLVHLCTDWMGDDAWLWRLACEFRRFNFVGDTQWLTGTVTRRYLADGDRPAVDLELTATNQRGEVTTPGQATVLLPSREHGPVRLPDPPAGTDELQPTLEAIAARFASGSFFVDPGATTNGAP